MPNFAVQDDPIVYAPGGRELRCSEVVAMRGGWENVSAEDATQLASLGCYPGFLDVGEQLYTGFEPNGGGGSLGGDVVAGLPPTNAPINDPEQVFSEDSMPTMNIDPTSLFISTVPMETGANTWMNFLQQGVSVVQGVQDIIQANQTRVPQYQVQVTPGASCWDHPMKNGRINRRARVKLVRLPDGSTQVLRYCAPKRMNPLNAQALRRAAVRLGRFHAIAGTIEKMVQKACRKGIGRGRIRSTPSCAPRKRCR